MIKHSANRVKIDLSALIHNLNEIRRLVGPEILIMGIVKADAYGHGQAPVSKTLEKNGVDHLGVAFIHEALGLRHEGVGCDIVVLCGIQTPEEAAAVVEHDLTPMVYDLDAIEMLSRESERRKKTTRIHLKVDTGMGRLGVFPADVLAFAEGVRAVNSLRLEGISSHLSSADEPVGDYTRVQIEAFGKIVETLRAAGVALPLNNLANSAGVMGFQEAYPAMVRPGIMLYGGLPSPEFRGPVSLRPVMHFSGRILQIRNFPDQTPVSYGRTYYTNGPRRIAVLSAGYSDGLPRRISNRGMVLIRGQRAPIVGRVCMNMTMCDVTAIDGVKTGEECVFLGTQGDECITVEELARWAETISYEIFCNIGQCHVKDYLS